ncbi:MAG: PKD domain-containing protein [bacterium]
MSYIYKWDFGDGNQAEGLLVSHTYEWPGTYTVTLTVIDGDDVSTITYIINVTSESSTYIWKFGDGNYAVGETTSHTYEEPGNFITTLNLAGDEQSEQITVLPPSIIYKKDYIRIQGPNYPVRFGECKFIDIIQYLPEYLKETELTEFLKSFEDYLNEMYDGSCGIELGESEVTVSAIDYTKDNYPSTSGDYRDSIYGIYDSDTSAILTTTDDVNSIEETNMCVPKGNKISILEKISRLRDLTNPDLIPINLIQYYTNNLGYDVGLNRDDIGEYYFTSADYSNFTEEEREEIKEFQNQTNKSRYLRFMARNLHEWYRIKTTRNAIQMMLFSFGLIGNFVYYYTTDYEDPENVDDIILGDVIDNGDLTFKTVYKQLCEYNRNNGQTIGVTISNILTGVGFKNWMLTSPSSIFNGNSIEDVRTIDDVDSKNNPYVPTPHFRLYYSIDDSEGNLTSEIDRQNNIAKAVRSIKPVNTVFHDITAYAERQAKKYIFPFMRVRRHIILRNE